MEHREAFGPNLRRLRLRRGVTLESIAAVTNVPVPLWEAFEDNDLYGWPSGVLARAFVAEYARLIGEDPDETVNEFCRLFPQGDRRRARVMGDYATLVGQTTVWSDEPPRREERRAALRRVESQRLASRRQRLAGILVDVGLITAAAAVASAAFAIAYPTCLITIALVYYVVCAAGDTSAGVRVVRAIGGAVLLPRRMAAESDRSPAR